MESPEVWLVLYRMCPNSNPPPLSKAFAKEYNVNKCSQSLNIYIDMSKIPDGDTGASFLESNPKVSKGSMLTAHISACCYFDIPVFSPGHTTSPGQHFH